MTTLYIISKIITFPGAYLKGFWEQLVCGLLTLPVERAGYLHKDESCGHAEHPLAKTAPKAFAMVFIPGFMNFFMGLFITVSGFVNLFVFNAAPSVQGEFVSKLLGTLFFAFSIIFLYFGVSLLCNVFPFVEDAINLYELLYKEKRGNIVLRALAFIPTVISYAGAYLEKYAVTVILWIVAIVCLSIL